jgi:hypothetical protein
LRISIFVLIGIRLIFYTVNRQGIDYKC